MEPEALPPRSWPDAAPMPDRAAAPAAPPRYAVGIVHYRAYRDLERCLASVKSQTSPPGRVIVADNEPDAREMAAMREQHPEVGWEARSNRGFSASANYILQRLRREDPSTEFFLLLNPDVELEPDFAEKLLGEMMQWSRAALACGKLLRPESETIDSAGILLPRHRRPRDRGSEERDRGQFDRTEFVFGASGAALVLRAAALDDLAIEGEVFDEDFFVYHEDTDLAWRANLLGWRVLYVPTARAMHTRHWRRGRRFEIAARIRRHSFKNHYLQMIKNERTSEFLFNLPAIASWEFMRLGYALVRDRAVLAAYRDAWRCSARAWRKRRILWHRVRTREVPGARAGSPPLRPAEASPVHADDGRDEQPGQGPV